MVRGEDIGVVPAVSRVPVQPRWGTARREGERPASLRPRKRLAIPAPLRPRQRLARGRFPAIRRRGRVPHRPRTADPGGSAVPGMGRRDGPSDLRFHPSRRVERPQALIPFGAMIPIIEDAAQHDGPVGRSERSRGRSNRPRRSTPLIRFRLRSEDVGSRLPGGV